MKETTALTVNLVSVGIACCCVGFLPEPYVVQANFWDGVLCQVVQVVKKNDFIKARRIKFQAKIG